VADEAPEGGADVIDALKDVFEREVDAQIPDLEEVPHQSRAKVDSRVLVVASRGAWFGYMTIGSAEVNWGERRGTVYDEASFAFSEDPRDWRYEKTVDEKGQEAREEQMVGEFLFLDELFAYIRFVLF
jgi:hypothetical protein